MVASVVRSGDFFDSGSRLFLGGGVCFRIAAMSTTTLRHVQVILDVRVLSTTLPFVLLHHHRGHVADPRVSGCGSALHMHWDAAHHTIDVHFCRFVVSSHLGGRSHLERAYVRTFYRRRLGDMRNSFPIVRLQSFHPRASLCARGGRVFGSVAILAQE